MPIYEYDCPVCGRFETIQRFSDSALTECPTCAEKGKQSHVEKAVSVSAFHLKGGGWYKTDYAKSGSTGSTSSGGSSKKESGDNGPSDSGSTPPATPPVAESKPAPEKSDSKESKPTV